MLCRRNTTFSGGTAASDGDSFMSMTTTCHDISLNIDESYQRDVSALNDGLLRIEAIVRSPSASEAAFVWTEEASRMRG